jgi:predicted transcriptional regulator
MKADALDLLFPVVRAEVLRALFHHTQREMYVSEIARWSELALRTVQRELAILIKIGLVTSRTNGYHVFYRANRNHVLFAPLQQLVFKSERCVLGKRKPRKRPRQSWRESGRRKRKRPSTFAPRHRPLTTRLLKAVERE